jgi:hypothetical protein
MDRQRGKQTVLSLLVYMKVRETEKESLCISGSETHNFLHHV